MSSAPHESIEKITVPYLQAAKERGERLTCLTAYDYPTARVVDESGVEIILVGDSAANVVLGYDNTVPVTLEEMLFLVRAVRRGTKRALLVADLPYGSYHLSETETVRNALRFVKEAGAEAVKLEGGRGRVETVERLVGEEIPVMGHIGLTPQSINKLGGYRVQGKTTDAAKRLLEDARLLEEAGAFAIVLELVPRELATMITESLRIPTIGIGAGARCDIQVLVLHDLLGLTWTKKPRFLRYYADLRGTMSQAITAWAGDVRTGEYPTVEESFALSEEVLNELKQPVVVE